MSAYERAKGVRIEREIVNLHKGIGIDAERVPLSGAAQYKSECHDLDIYPRGRGRPSLRGEVKGRASGAGFTLLERWLSDSDVLFLRRDRQEPLVLVPWRVWAELLAESHLTGTQPNPKNGHDAVTYARPGGSLDTNAVRKGGLDVHSDEP